MEEITVAKAQLPDTIEELSQFVFIGREKLTALKAAIKACTKSEVVAEKVRQMKEEEQGLAEAVLLGETKIGELLLQMEKAKGGRGKTADNGVRSLSEKLNVNERTVYRSQVLARHQDLVEEAIQEAKNSDRAVTRQDVLNKVRKSQAGYIKRKIQKAEDEHREFTENKPNDFTAYREDKNNLKTLAPEWERKLIKAEALLSEACGYSEADIRKFRKILESDRKAILVTIVGANNHLKTIFNIFKEESK